MLKFVVSSHKRLHDELGSVKLVPHGTYCTTVRAILSHLHILYTVHTVHVPCFPVSDVEVSPSTSVHTLVHML